MRAAKTISGRGNRHPRVGGSTRLPQGLRELATLLESGISAAEAFQKSSFHEHPAGRTAAKKLRQGQSVASVLGLTLLPSPADRTLLAAAEFGGFLPETLRELAQHAEQRDRRIRQLKSRSVFYLAVLAIAWLAGVVVAYFSVEQSVLQALFVNTALCVVMGIFLRGINRLLMQDSWWWLNALCRFGRLHTPVTQKLMAARWLSLLGRQLAAGIDAARSLENMVKLLPDTDVSQAVRDAARLTAQGHSMAQALSEVNLVTAPEVVGPLVAGEHSGRLPEALAHAAALADAQLQSLLSELVAWIPRFLYVIVCLFSISVIF